MKVNFSRRFMIFAFSALSLLLFLSFIIPSYFLKDIFEVPKIKSSPSKTISIGHKTIRVYIAETEAAQEKGLGGKMAIGNNEGMIFVFDHPYRYGIWMRDMKFSIDIFWIGETNKITDIKESAEPSSFPEIFYPSTRSSYVLEVNAGFAKANGIKVGDKVTF